MIVFSIVAIAVTTFIFMPFVGLLAIPAAISGIALMTFIVLTD